MLSEPRIIASESAEDWVAEEMATAELGDRRLNKRLVTVLRRMFDSPMASLKSALKGWAEVMAAYRFFDNEKVDEAALLAPHQEALLQRVDGHSQVLVIQDTTEIDYSTKKHLDGMGSLSIEQRQGFFAHCQYVVTPDRVPLGVWETSVYAREKGASEVRLENIPIEEKESYRWLQGYRHACRLQELAPKTQVVSTSDREGDIYEIFLEWQKLREEGRVAAEWLIRSCQDRCLMPFEENPGMEGATPIPAKLRAAVEQSPVLGTVEFSVEKRKGRKKVKGKEKRKRTSVVTERQARWVKQEIRAINVTLQAPRRKNNKLEPVKIWVVLASEINPPPGQDPIRWLLLTSLPVETFEAAQAIVSLYMARWEIEMFHRVLKSGCRVEELQLKSADRIKPAIVLYMIVAWRILYLTKLGRECPNLPCDVVFEEAEWRAVYHVVKGRKAVEPPMLGEMIRMIASLGGFLGRKSDGDPGAQSFWFGFMRAKDFATAWLIFAHIRA